MHSIKKIINLYRFLTEIQREKQNFSLFIGSFYEY